MTNYIAQWVECAGSFYPEYRTEPDEYYDDDELELSLPTLKDTDKLQEF